MMMITDDDDDEDDGDDEDEDDGLPVEEDDEILAGGSNLRVGMRDCSTAKLGQAVGVVTLMMPMMMRVKLLMMTTMKLLMMTLMMMVRTRHQTFNPIGCGGGSRSPPYHINVVPK